MRTKRMVALVTAVATIASVASITASAQSSVVGEHMIISADNYKLSKDFKIDSDSTIAGNKAWELIFSTDGVPCYSLEPGKSAVSSTTQGGNYVYNKLKEIEYELTDMQKVQLEQVLLYSYTDTPEDMANIDEYAPKYIATQLLIWEVVSEQRSSYYSFYDNWLGYKRDFNCRDNGNAVYKLISDFSDKDRSTMVAKYYNQYEQAIISDSKRITFAGDKETALETDIDSGRSRISYLRCKSTLVRSRDENTGEYTFYDYAHNPVEAYSSKIYMTDMNNQLDNFDIEISNGELISRSEGQFTAKANVKQQAELKFTHKETERCGLSILDGNKESESAIVYPEAVNRVYYLELEGTKEEPTTEETTSPSEDIVTLLGDVNLDGAVGVSDIIGLAKYNANNKIYPIKSTANADVNRDGKVNMADLSRLIEYYLGSIPSL